jgi:hypothetical protein
MSSSLGDPGDFCGLVRSEFRKWPLMGKGGKPQITQISRIEGDFWLARDVAPSEREHHRTEDTEGTERTREGKGMVVRRISRASSNLGKIRVRGRVRGRVRLGDEKEWGEAETSSNGPNVERRPPTAEI